MNKDDELDEEADEKEHHHEERKRKSDVQSKKPRGSISPRVNNAITDDNHL